MDPETDFESTLLAARAGAEWAWRDLYRRFSPHVLRYLYARKAPDPEDLTAEVFLLVVSRLHQFEGGDGAFRAWVVTIAHRRYIDEIRSRNRRPVDPTDDDTLVLAGAEGDVEHDALRNVEAGDLRKAIAELPDSQKDVLFLRLIAGFSIAEVATATGRTPGAVKSLQMRAIWALRKTIGGETSSGEAVS
jgi:RNA polymerase sigma-70 factor (ECF subfamily)